MAAAVKLHAAGGNLLQVKIGVDDRFLIPDSFAGIMAKGVDDAAAAAAGDVRKAGNFICPAFRLRVIRLADHKIGVYKVAVAFDCDVTDGMLPFGIIICVR